MERITDLAKAEAKVLGDMQAIISSVRQLSAGDVESVRHGFERLRVFRATIYEDLNQIQHEFLILEGLRWLRENGFGSEIQWEWNPRQTGNSNEPDLRGSANGKVVVSAEASASESPIGTVDSRMKETLEKLNQMEGKKFYFVRTDAMANRAETKIGRTNLSIRVVRV